MMRSRFTPKDHVTAVVSVLVISLLLHGLMMLGEAGGLAHAGPVMADEHAPMVVLPPTLR